jgi:hypothetical protein
MNGPGVQDEFTEAGSRAISAGLIPRVFRARCRYRHYRAGDNGRAGVRGRDRRYFAWLPTWTRVVIVRGQPVVIGASMGTGSYILTAASENQAFASSSHGTSRAMSRHQALAQRKGPALADELAQQGTLIRTRSTRGVAEEAPGAYKAVDLVAEATEQAGLARRVAFLRPTVYIKG